MPKFTIKLSFLLCIVHIRHTFQEKCPGKLITDLNQKACTDKATSDTAYYLDRSSCIPKCKVYPTEVQTGDCSTDPNACIPGYSCESRCGPATAYQETPCKLDSDCRKLSARAKCGKYCKLPAVGEGDDSVSCMSYHSNMIPDKWWTAKKFKPVCDDDGNWESKQCKGGLHGRCLCYSSKGIRLFGQAPFAKSAKMTCACSRRKSDLESAGRTYVSFHCDSMGNYEKFQCDVEKGLCWCAEPSTGELTSPFVPYGAMKQLPCYSEANVGSQYLRQCESKKFAVSMITAKLKRHGVVTVEPDTLMCDADGSYGAYSVSSGIAYCTWRDNSKIGTWQANIGGMKDKLTCNCARDFKMYSHTQNCEGTGNYVILQQTYDQKGNKKYYCVDEDGFAKTDLLDDPNTNCTLYY